MLAIPFLKYQLPAADIFRTRKEWTKMLGEKRAAGERTTCSERVIATQQCSYQSQIKPLVAQIKFVFA